MANTPKRPANVPEDAIYKKLPTSAWSSIPRDAQGKEHGLGRYWRADGSIVNECNYEHGLAHGAYKRFHENGEVSREGTFDKGKLVGLEIRYRSSAPTTEVAMQGIHSAVWRYECELGSDGKMITARFYDREGRRVTDRGERFPERPAGVPEQASFSHETGLWFTGAMTERGPEGLWQRWNAEGALVEEEQFEVGKSISKRGVTAEAAQDVAPVERTVDFATKFATTPFADLEKRAPFAQANEDMAVKDLFGRPPKSGGLHEGDLTIADDVFFWPDGYGYYVLDGSLEIEGSFFFAATDAANVIIVKGDLRARNLFVSGEAHLYVFGHVEVENLIVSHTSDGGWFGCKRTRKARAILDMGENESTCSGKTTGAALERDDLASPYRSANDDKLFDALKAGKDVLRPGALAAD